ncbi:MAG: alpha/beta hydrolase, partial [Segetibacter sp.]
ALDYLTKRNDIDNSPIAALNDRIKVCVVLCCLTDYPPLMEEKGLALHRIYYYVPDLLNHFTTSQINRFISPGPRVGLAGNQDARICG